MTRSVFPVMRSLALKLTLAFLIVGLIGAVLVALFVGLRTQSEFDRFVLDRYQQDLVTTLTNWYSDRGSWDNIAAITLQTPFGQRGRDIVRAPVTLVDADGVVVYGGRYYRVGQQLTEPELNNAVPIEVDGKTVGRLLFSPGDFPFAPRETPESAFLARVNQAILFGALGATLVALILGILLARSISRPVRELTQATEAVAHGDLGRQVVIRTNDEIGELAESFNQMSSDLARGLHLRRQMTADIAHDLRTPLSVILGYSEALADGKLRGTTEIFDVVHHEAQHLQHLIDDLRILSLADAGELSLSPQRLAPRPLLERAVATNANQAETKGVDLVVKAGEALPPIRVDSERMAQVLNNLLTNAIRYTPTHGEVVLRAEAENGDVQLVVSDTGVGIPVAELANIFERFYRVDAARDVYEGESGLGLAIAKSLVEAQGGTIAVASEVGHGTTFTLTFPAD